MNQSEIDQLKSLLTEPVNAVIVPHKNPDGDAMGSCLGLSHYLKAHGHNAVVIAPNDYPQFLKWIPGNDEVVIFEYNRMKALEIMEEADLIFTLDFNDLARTGEMENALKESSKTMVMIDHHQQPKDYAKFVYSDPEICSTSQMIYHFLEKLDDVSSISPQIATCLYVGIMTDTGSFRFASTTSTTHRVIADLIDKGANNSEIHINVYDNQSFNRLQLLGQALNNLKVIPEYHTAYIILSQDELNRYQFKKGDTEGVVNYALSVQGVKFALIFIEHRQEGIVKISLRSKCGFDVNQFARNHFNGGGHINAAGGRSNKSLEQTIEDFITILPKYKNDLKS
ncbi:MAG: bifunctional oligoribonuclease/PAP phosphatase NrnA [Bacteroidia bacterium]|nr:bifunctional oligoribonuclease/PAP phosphatase NrnA [Bacteroidia bacterium]MBT8267786.1 bifunctional oligoribonuclease/PAP phosphatase NrnA [Bacteroidia bacterium]NNK70143.1 bifunctional oligoribonuclease/PAP phosphatase NrnA [Flavobacteriaceae bacterium]NNL81633.1 bifunctional oligoribonuclease/PAP phosphatase NrnA [Flavobacteriaceae bacterium]